MKKFIYFFIIVCISISFADAQKNKESKPFFELSKKEIHTLLKETVQKPLTITERMQYYAQRFLNTPYNLTCVGDGPYALYETMPLVTFDDTNCMAYCEHILALAISDSWEHFFNNLQHIRYKDGIIGMKTRNHYTMGDWLPENDWLLVDATKRIGGQKAEPLTRTISHKQFFARKGIEDKRFIKPDRSMTIHYIPTGELASVKENIASGDIACLIFADKDNIFSAHMIMFFRENERLVIRESSNRKMTTFETPFNKWLEEIKNSNRYLGLSFMRVRDELNKPFNVIYPWEIKDLKALFRANESS